LVLVPDGALELAPLGALYDRERRQYLVEQATVSLAPSATLAAALLARSNRRGVAGRDTALVVGAPVLENTGHADLEALPGAAAEAAAIAKLYGRSVLLVGRDATRERFVSELSRCRVAHFAGHALTMVGSTDSSMLLFTPASPSEGGELSAARVRSLSLPDLDLVVLAACRSAAGYSPGREGPMSLASAFIAAGVPTVIAAAGPVDDRAAPRLMHRLHSLVASGTDPPAALREVMLECLRSRDPALQAPSAWAMFTAFGI
jgi:CHAT domain-containing protein